MRDQSVRTYKTEYRLSRLSSSGTILSKQKHAFFSPLGGSPVYREVLKWPSVSCRFRVSGEHKTFVCAFDLVVKVLAELGHLTPYVVPCLVMTGYLRREFLGLKLPNHTAYQQKNVFISQFLSVGNKYMSTCPTSKCSAWSTHTEHLNQLRLG